MHVRLELFLTRTICLQFGATYVEVHDHAIALVAIDGRCHHDEGVLSDKVANAALLRSCDKVELESANGADKQQNAAEVLQQ